MSKKYKAKNRTKKIVAGIVAAVVAIAALAGIIALFRPNTKDEKIKINPAFSVGALDENGAYEQSDSTLYTKDAFDAEGLETKVAFDATISYQLFYYDENVDFISASGTLNVNYVAELPEGAEYARVMIMPDWTGVEVEDQEIGVLDKSKYTSQIEFWVNNPDYVEVEDGDEGSETSNKWTHENLEIYSEYWGRQPGSYVQDGGEPNYFEMDSLSEFAATFKPVSMKAGDYYVCFNTNNKTITGPSSYIYSFMYKNESGDGYEGEFQQALGAFIESDATVDGYEYAVKINLPRDAEVYIACDIGILPSFTVIKA